MALLHTQEKDWEINQENDNLHNNIKYFGITLTKQVRDLYGIQLFMWFPGTRTQTFMLGWQAFSWQPSP